MSAQSITDISNQYNFNQLADAGGWVTGMDIHPSGDPILARADVGDAYRWNPATQRWISLVNTATMSASDYGTTDVNEYDYRGVASIVSAPGNANRLYMALNGRLFFSNNKGDSWTKASNVSVGDVYMEENARDGREWGERLAVDPQNPNVVYYGSNQDGLLRSTNGGQNWTVPTTSVPVGLAAKRGGNTSYPGVIPLVDGTSSLTSGRSSRVFALVFGEGIYISNNGGNSFSKSLDGTTFNDIEISSNGDVFVTAGNVQLLSGAAVRNGKKVYRYRNGSWTQLNPGNKDWWDVAVNNNEVWVVDRGVSKVWYSDNSGSNWQQFNFSLNANDVPYLGNKVQSDFVSMGELVYNQATGKLWASLGDRVTEFRNARINNMIGDSRSRGIGELVSYDLEVMQNGNILTAAADKGIIVSDIDGPGSSTFPSSFLAAWDIARSEGNPSFATVVLSPQPWNPQGNYYIGYTNNNGNSFSQFPTIPDPASANNFNPGRLAVSSGNTQNIVWLPLEGSGQIYYTNNRGNSWSQSNYSSGFPNGKPARQFSHSRWLIADPVSSGTFYLCTGTGGDQNMKIFRSTNGGANWSQVGSTNLPWGFHAKFKAVPTRAGHLFYTSGLAELGTAQLRRSTNGGANWSVVQGTSEVVSIAIGKAQTPGGYPTIFIQGKVNGQVGLYSSYDQGQSWNKIASHPLRIWDDVPQMVGDMERFGNVYGVFGSHSPWAAQYSGSTPPPTTYTLNVSASNGSVSKSPNQSSYPAGSAVTLTATPATGYQFSGWSGNASGSNNPLTVTMNSNQNITANFSQQGGGGNCGQNLSGTLKVEHCEPQNGAVIPQGSPIVITPDFSADIVKVTAWYDGWNFIGNAQSAPFEITWNGAAAGQHTLRIRGENASGTKTAKRDITITVGGSGPQTYTLNASGSNGSVGKSPNQSTYTAGSSVTLTANPNAGYEFSNWSGDASGNSNPLTITMNSNKNITANFSLIPPTTYTLNINASNGSVSKSPNQSNYPAGSQVTLTASPNAGYVFSGWSGNASGNNNPLTITMNSNKSITANFAQQSANCGGNLSGTLKVEHCSPQDGDVIPQGSPIVIKPDHSSDIVKMSAWYDGWNFIANDLSAPFEITWNGASVGQHTLRIRGENAAGTRTARKDITITVSSSSRIAVVAMEEVYLYPNPLTGKFLSVRGPASRYEVEIYNLQGQRLFRGEIEPNKRLSVAGLGLTRGTYLVRLRHDSHQSSHQLIVP
ncbi:MAG: InlB B-repeat-containing protein [Bacteroidota bacterium]